MSIAYTPVWEDVQSLAKVTSIKNEWRTVFLSIEWEDLLQEAWIKFYDIVYSRRYQFENKWHFVEFFRQSFNNKIIDMIKYKKLEKEAVDQFASENSEGECLLENIFKSGDSSDFNTKLNEAPEHIKNVLQLLQNYPENVINLSRISNKRICLMLGYDDKTIDLVKEVKQYFRGE